jgi:hypothetical protein
MPQGPRLRFRSPYHQKMVNFKAVAEKTVRRLRTSGRFFSARVSCLPPSHWLEDTYPRDISSTLGRTSSRCSVWRCTSGLSITTRGSWHLITGPLTLSLTWLASGPKSSSATRVFPARLSASRRSPCASFSSTGRRSITVTFDAHASWPARPSSRPSCTHRLPPCASWTTSSPRRTCSSTRACSCRSRRQSLPHRGTSSATPRRRRKGAAPGRTSPKPRRSLARPSAARRSTKPRRPQRHPPHPPLSRPACSAAARARAEAEACSPASRWPCASSSRTAPCPSGTCPRCLPWSGQPSSGSPLQPMPSSATATSPSG